MSRYVIHVTRQVVEVYRQIVEAPSKDAADLYVDGDMFEYGFNDMYLVSDTCKYTDTTIAAAAGDGVDVAVNIDGVVLP